mmetsp:Transcript_23524/g.71989  ORF Transcript_23524/g.71989 Transcript_23524/m.71989 type:complete len:212 (-) Transcript_23524:834-1469(-)
MSCVPCGCMKAVRPRHTHDCLVWTSGTTLCEGYGHQVSLGLTPSVLPRPHASLPRLGVVEFCPVLLSGIRIPVAETRIRRTVLLVVILRRGRGHVHLHVWRGLQLPQVLEDLGLDLLEVLGQVGVFHIRGRLVVKLIVGTIVLVVLVVRQVIGYVLIEHNGSLVCPTARDVADCVTATTEDQGRQLLLQHKVDALGVSLDGQIEASKAVAT